MEKPAYKSGKTLAKVTRLFLLFTAICSGIYAVLRIIEYLFFFSTSVINKNSGDYLIFTLLLGLFSLVVILFSFATPIVFLCWQFRAAKNLLSLNESAISNSPFSNVGWWFVPFASLVMPFQCINEILNGSLYENALDKDYLADSSGSKLTGWWWFFYLVSGFIGLATTLLAFKVAKQQFEFMPYFVISLIFSHSFSIIATILIRKIIFRIDNFQEESYKLLCERNELLNPPNPPKFE